MRYILKSIASLYLLLTPSDGVQGVGIKEKSKALQYTGNTQPIQGFLVQQGNCMTQGGINQANVINYTQGQSGFLQTAIDCQLGCQQNQMCLAAQFKVTQQGLFCHLSVQQGVYSGDGTIPNFQESTYCYGKVQQVQQANTVNLYAAQNGYTMTQGACKLPGGVAPAYSMYVNPQTQQNPYTAEECQQACQIDATCHSAHFQVSTHNCMISRQAGLYTGDGQQNMYCYAKNSFIPTNQNTNPACLNNVWHPVNMPLGSPQQTQPILYTEPASKREFTWYPSKQTLYTYVPLEDNQYVYTQSSCREEIFLKGVKSKMTYIAAGLGGVCVCCIICVFFGVKGSNENVEEQPYEEAAEEEEGGEQEGRQTNDRTNLLAYFKKQQKRKRSPGNNDCMSNSNQSSGDQSTQYQ